VETAGNRNLQTRNTINTSCYNRTSRSWGQYRRRRLGDEFIGVYTDANIVMGAESKLYVHISALCNNKTTSLNMLLILLAVDGTDTLTVEA
jgi:hypothetical protein